MRIRQNVLTFTVKKISPHKDTKANTHTHYRDSLILDYLTLILRCLPSAVAATSVTVSSP